MTQPRSIPRSRPAAPALQVRAPAQARPNRSSVRPRTALALGALTLAVAASTAMAGAVTDGSAGPVQTLSGHFTVPQSLGTLRGANLLHSFTQLGIGRDESATFMATDPAVRHVIARVTGDQASVLEGPLRLLADGATRPDFWLINPRGLVIGPGAQFDVPGGLHLSSAPLLRMAGGLSWDSRTASPSTLSVAAPESFGFLPGAPAAPLTWSGANLTLQPGRALTLAGGDVSVQGSVLSAPDGRIRVQAEGRLALTDFAYLYATRQAAPGSGEIRVDAAALHLDGANGGAGLIVEAGPEARVPGGGIEITTPGAVQLHNGALISSVNGSAFPTGPVRITAGSMAVDGQGQDTAVASWAAAAGGAGAGLEIDIAGATTLVNGGNLFSSALGPGPGGRIHLHTGTLAMDAAGAFAVIGTQASGDGSAGAVIVDVRAHAQLVGGAQISSGATGAGPAGGLFVSAGSLHLGSGHGVLTGLQSYGASEVRVDVAGELTMDGGTSIGSSGARGVVPGEVRVQARRITIDGQGAVGSIGSLTSNDGDAAPVFVSASDRIELWRGGQIQSGSIGGGGAGAVTVSAPTIDLRGTPGPVTGIHSSGLDVESGPTGRVEVSATRLTLADAAGIGTSSISERGNAGNVQVTAESLRADGGGLPTAIQSVTFSTTRDAGQVRVQVRDGLELLAGGGISAGSAGSGRSGTIDVRAGSLRIDGRGAPEVVTGIGGDAFGLSAGAAVNVEARQVEILEGGQISSSALFDNGSAAGSVRVVADSLRIDGGGPGRAATGISTDTNGAGAAGNLTLLVREALITSEGLVSSSTLGTGRGGAIRIEADRLTLQQGGTLASVAAGSGHAGDITLRVADALVLQDGGIVAANTGGAGAAGSIDVHAGTLRISGSDPASGTPSRLASRARAESGGQPGRIDIVVDGRAELRDGAVLTIANDAVVADPARVQPTTLSLQAACLALAGADITAAASGNAAAGSIRIDTAGALRARDSVIRTSAVDGDGGSVALVAGGPVWLHDSQVTTSVSGARSGNGGDISIRSPALVLQSGFVQANTEAPRARGGNVTIDAALLLPDGDRVFIGGDRIEAVRRGVAGANVIQAAAPDGLSGNLTVAQPQLGLAGSLVGLAVPRVEFGALGRDLCQIGTDSSLTVLGRGALPAPASAPLRIEP